MHTTEPFELDAFPVHLGSGGSAAAQERFTGTMDWYARYEARHGAEGGDGRLISLHHFVESWDSWEMHPRGDELVLCMSGRITLLQEQGSEPRRAVLVPGLALINPAGVWHTADVEGPASALFVTAGLGTEVRPRGRG